MPSTLNVNPKIKRTFTSRSGVEFLFRYLLWKKIEFFIVPSVGRWTDYSGSSLPALPPVAISPLNEKPATDFAKGIVALGARYLVIILSGFTGFMQGLG